MSLRRHRAALGTAALACLLLAGCAGVQVRSLSPTEYVAQRRSDALTAGRLGTAAQEALRIIGRDGAWCEQAHAECQQALTGATGLSDEQRLATLSEVWVHAAMAAERRAADPADTAAVGPWLEAARHAYGYLFFTGRDAGERAFEDRQTQVRDYYNYAVQQAVTRLFHASQRMHGHGLREVPPVAGWRIRADASAMRLPADTPLPAELIPASSLAFSGLRNTYRRDGFGAELVAVAEEGTARPRAPGPARRDAPPFRETPFVATTVLMRFEGRDLRELLATRSVEIAIFDPHRSSDAMLAGERVPLAANFTSGYGLWLARSGFARQALRTLFGQAEGITAPQVYLLQPYDPSRRIVVMLHGLASSPEAWINVANEVLGDEALRQRYQIWQVYYPTNAPLALNLRRIRQALDATLAHFDPAGTAPASQDITLIGHSMGGVLSRLLVSSSGDALEQALAGQDVSPRLRRRLAPYLRFEPQPQVGRAIFIAAPHRGTPFAAGRAARWLAGMITLPLALLGDLADGLDDEPQALQIPTSIDNLSDRDPFVRLVADLPIGPRLRYHSIIGNDTPALALAQSSDGVVPYASAHLAGAQSERVIESAHSVQEHPQAILEIRRILREAP